MKHLMEAIHKIRHNPGRRMKFSGKYDANGSPVMRSDSQYIMPGSQFEMDDQDSDFQTFLDLGAIAHVEDAAQQALWRKNRAVAQSLGDIGGDLA